MKRILAVALLTASVVLVSAVNGSAHHRSRHTITVVEHATTDAVTNGTKADHAGNILTFANRVFNAADTKKVGTDQGSCVRIVVGKSWECMWTTFLPRGQITVEGPFYDTSNSTLAITGGTGAYRNARGQMRLKYHNPAGTKFDFVFHLIR
ncbi:MAG: Allene oxide cyclase [Actinobacteria bacterium]|jgi:allene oxide cyclase|nr:MAG: Allene oxide cyclase [Actinomycetota bacterium]